MNLFEFDENFKCCIIGTDEAGRGPGAGPVYAAAVYFPDATENVKKILSEINDSKKLTPKKREELFEPIKENSIYSIQISTVEEIEEMNILNASLNAMKKACGQVIEQAQLNDFKVLIDGNKLIKNVEFKQQFIIKGDGKSASIAAASILAKVSRDRFMQKLHLEFPQYHWNKNKGYLTKEHIDAIFKFGTTKWHRKKFVENLVNQQKLF